MLLQEALHQTGLQYAGNRGRAALATGERKPHASGQARWQISISRANEKSHRASMLVTLAQPTAPSHPPPRPLCIVCRAALTLKRTELALNYRPQNR